VREHFHVDLQSVRLVRVEFALSRFIEARASFHVDHQHRQKQANIHACIHTSMQTYIHIYTNVHAGELVLFLNPCRTMVQQKSSVRNVDEHRKAPTAPIFMRLKNQSVVRLLPATPLNTKNQIVLVCPLNF